MIIVGTSVIFLYVRTTTAILVKRRMTAFYLRLLMVVAALFLIDCGGVFSLKCYKKTLSANEMVEEICPSLNDTNSWNSTLNGGRPVCWKTTPPNPDIESITRGCGVREGNMECVKSLSNYSSLSFEEICYCDVDLCNTASPMFSVGASVGPGILAFIISYIL
ncbi:uncharacterized protein LOC129589610 [Paramacrobiotus metropolitanus]|uniref:uncharacterized protein LOC129589610 n=1 Tax=Paramacrobiotus metropolitanus TaxID=2943436 RepID=UPI002445B215|nr:uncharacterized protein LOC129589610 [Paramacrobiotus metropolitanus]